MKSVDREQEQRELVLLLLYTSTPREFGSPFFVVPRFEFPAERQLALRALGYATERHFNCPPTRTDMLAPGVGFEGRVWKHQVEPLLDDMREPYVGRKEELTFVEDLRAVFRPDEIPAEGVSEAVTTNLFYRAAYGGRGAVREHYLLEGAGSKRMLGQMYALEAQDLLVCARRTEPERARRIVDIGEKFRRELVSVLK